MVTAGVTLMFLVETKHFIGAHRAQIQICFRYMRAGGRVCCVLLFFNSVSPKNMNLF